MSDRCFRYTACGLLAYIGSQVSEPAWTGIPMLLAAAVFFITALYVAGK